MKFVLCIILVACFSSPSFSSPVHLTASDERKPPQHTDFNIEIEDGLVYMDVNNAEIVYVVKEIARKAKIDLSIDDGVEGMVSIKLSGAPIEDALKKLCENRAIVFEYLPEKKAYRIVSVGAYLSEEGDRDASGLDKAGETRKEGKRVEAKTPDTGDAYQAPRQSKAESAQGTQKIYDSKGRPLYRSGEVLVKFKEGVSERQIASLHTSLGSTVLKRVDRLRLQRIKLREGLSAREAISRYSASDIVEIVERHALRYPNLVPNDTHFEEQWGLNKIKAPMAWDMAQGDNQIIIAVIDTGVDYSHPDLADNIWTNAAELNGKAGVDDDGNGYVDDIYGWDFAGKDKDDPDDEDAEPMDVDGHGTHVAGIIAAKGNNGLGVAGVHWNAKIMVLKVQADNGENMDGLDIIRAIQYAIDKEARIVNCSFGSTAPEDSEEEAFADLRDAGILAVCAAGNEELDTDETPNYPSSHDLDNIMAVAASDRNDNLASFSNYGLSSVDIMAPGVDIKSTIPAFTPTEALVKSGEEPNITQYQASGMLYAGTTDENGITRVIYDCGKGYPDEFPSGVSGNIALIERGNRDGTSFYFYEKTANAQNAGAVAVVIYNNEPGNFEGTLGSPGDWIPLVSISKEDGEDLKGKLGAGGNLTVTLVNSQIDDPSFYGSRQGTSMAAPHAAGIAGLILSQNPGLDYASVKSAVLDSVDKVPSVAGKMVTGGRVNALNALCSITDAVPGDLSCDDAVALDDAILALQVVSGLQPEICTPCIAYGIDVNGDGRIGIEEIIYALQEVGGFTK